MKRAAGSDGSGLNPGSHREGAVKRAMGVFSKKNGEHSHPLGRRAPRVGMNERVKNDPVFEREHAGLREKLVGSMGYEKDEMACRQTTTSG